MKLRTTVGALLNAFATTSPTLDTKGVGSNLYLQANEKSGFLYFYSTNLITETAAKIKAEIEIPGEVLINSGKMSDGLVGLPKETPIELSLTPTGNSLKVQAGNVKFSLTTSSEVKELGNRMRAIPSKSVPAAIIPIAELNEFTKRTLFCIPNDQTGQRAVLSALKLSDSDDKEEAFATDGTIVVHISSVKKQSKGAGLGASGLLIPSQALQPLAKLAAKKKGETVSIILTETRNKAFFKFADGTHFGVLTLNSQYPNLRPVVNQSTQYKFEIPRETFKQSLDRASSFVSSSVTKRVLELELNGDTLALRANGEDALSDAVTISYIGTKPAEAIRFGMNIDHLFNIASGSHSEFLTFGFTKDDQPLIITDKEGDDDERIDVKYIVMGVRLAGAQK